MSRKPRISKRRAAILRACVQIHLDELVSKGQLVRTPEGLYGLPAQTTNHQPKGPTP